MMTDLHRTERTESGQSALVQRPLCRTDRTPPYRVSGLSVGWTPQMVPMSQFPCGRVTDRLASFSTHTALGCGGGPSHLLTKFLEHGFPPLAEILSHLSAKKKVGGENSVFNAQAFGRGFYEILNRPLNTIGVDQKQHGVFASKPAVKGRLLNTVQRGSFIQSNFNRVGFCLAVHADILVALINRVGMRYFRLASKDCTYNCEGFRFNHCKTIPQTTAFANFDLRMLGGPMNG